MTERRPCVLLIEDDASLLEVMAMNLEDFGFQVDVASSGEAGVAAYDPARHDVTLTDLRMPGMSGLDVLDTILGREPGAIVLVLTAYGGAENALEAMRRGAFHYVEKPVNTRALIDELERALRHKQGAARPRSQRAMVASSPAMNKVLRIVDRVAEADAPVMILGESGVGKELVARAIHERSGRAENAFVAVNCAAIPAELLESVLFGYVKGAFTGAARRTDGKFSAAHGGTLFLDEIAEMSVQLQSKLLRVLQDGFIERVGSVTPERVDVRILTATHQDLPGRIEQGLFRQDLYFRLHVVPLVIPALRGRREDIPVLMRHFLRVVEAPAEVEFSARVDDVFMAYDWPGNVRELRNVIERMVLLREDDLIDVADIPPELLGGARASAHSRATTSAGLPFELPEDELDLRELERQIIMKTLERFDGNRSATARYLKIPRHVLIYRLEKFGI